MKKFLLGFLFISSACFASGKIQLKPSYFVGAKQMAPQVGLAIYEKVLGPIAWNQWVGFGWQPRVGESSVLYAVSTQEFEIWFNRVGVSLGYKFQFADTPVMDLVSENSVFAKISVPALVVAL